MEIGLGVLSVRVTDRTRDRVRVWVGAWVWVWVWVGSWKYGARYHGAHIGASSVENLHFVRLFLLTGVHQLRLLICQEWIRSQLYHPMMILVQAPVQTALHSLSCTHAALAITTKAGRTPNRG